MALFPRKKSQASPNHKEPTEIGKFLKNSQVSYAKTFSPSETLGLVTLKPKDMDANTIAKPDSCKYMVQIGQKAT